MAQALDALFISYYANADRWHNDLEADPPPNLARTRGVLAALSDDVWMKDEVDIVIDGRLYDFSRFLSWVQYGSTVERVRFDPFNMTLLAGTYYLNLLSAHGFDIRVANAADRFVLEELGAAYHPRFVLLSTTLLFDAADRDAIPTAVRQIRAQWPDAVVVLGGLMLVSYEKNLPRPQFLRLLRDYGADAYVVSPRGETPLLEILGCGSAEGLFTCSSIPRTYVVSGQTVVAPSDAPEVGLDMADTHIRWSRLPQTEHLYHTAHVRTARSCAFRCAFCEYPINQGPLTLAPVDVVKAELDELKALGTVSSIVFTDDTFNVPLRRFKQLLRVLAEYDFEWYSFFRPQYADEETAQLMKASGCRAVFAGLESVDDRILKNMNKAAKADAYKRGIDQLKRHDIQVHANFIVGFPGETEESARKIIPFLDQTGIDFCTVCTWAYIPSTPIAARAEEFGIEGMGMTWRHDTMTSEAAQALAREVATEQKSAVHNAVRGEAWMEFLMYANGFSVADVRLAVSCFNRCLGRDVAAEDIRGWAEYPALKDVLEANEMPRPEGVRV
jgi:anaerobic magnesium-protoporphyrin IX monomethyl ester cyclase